MATNLDLMKVACWNVAAFVVGIVGAAYFDSLGFLAFGVGTVGLITFFGVLSIGTAGGTEMPGDGVIRRTITLTIVAVYAVLVASMAFFDVESSVQGLLLNFTTLTTVVIAFYIGSSAYLESQVPRTVTPRGVSGAAAAEVTPARARKRAARPTR